MRIDDLGTLAYRPAWELQERAHAEVVEGGPERLLLVEHPPVITFGRRGVVERNLLASREQLARAGVEVVESDRGGDVTYHGLGQLVVYPIVRLADHHLSVSGYVHTLESAVIAALADEWGIASFADRDAVGVWVNVGGGVPSKICAIGVRIRRGVSMHGLALNVTTDLSHFSLIVPCGLARQRSVTSLQHLLGERGAPTVQQAKTALARKLSQRFAAETSS